MKLPLPVLDADPLAPFPLAQSAFSEPNGLLAMGGDLSPVRLFNAYRNGIFPWYSQGQPILWWSPDPRMVFATDGVHLASRLRRRLRGSDWVIRADTAFDAVISACARTLRAGQTGTWITGDMQAAYCRLHRLGHAHSIEVFDAGLRLVGGMYGVAIGRMFFGESMFSGQSGGSKVALAALAQRLQSWGWPLIDAQVENPHLVALGAQAWPRSRFLREIKDLTQCETPAGSWTVRFADLPARSLADRPPTSLAAD